VREGALKLDITKALKMLMVDKNIKQVDVASRFYDSETSKNTFNNLIRRNDYKLNDIVKIAGIMDYDVKLQFVDRESGKIIAVD
jgi:phosphoribosylaminoimidazole-succinocarboxamide synthase